MLTMHSFFNDELSWHCPLLYFAIIGYAEFIRTYPKIELRPAMSLRRMEAPVFGAEQQLQAKY
jgi:hypothetical protein